MIRRVTVPPHRPLSAPSRTGRFFGSAQRISRSGLLALGLASAPLAGHAEASAPLPSVIDEASGLARSSVHEGIFWTHNDNIALPASSGSGPPILYALKSDGQLAGQVTLTGANKRDWEAIARARWQARPVLLVGDIGDNLETHEYYRILIVEEPSEFQPAMTIPLLGEIRFRYPDRAQDTEAMVYDRSADRLLLLTKRRKRPMLYQLPLEPTGDRVIEAQPVAQLEGFSPRDPITWLANPLIGPFAHQPTGMDIRPDGLQMAVLTYSTVYLFNREPDQTWGEALEARPGVASLPRLDQWEGIAYTADGKSLMVVHEGKRGALNTLDLSR
ncbi:MAG: hypothetical protein ACLFSG_09440 [Halothiobacillaceae bacterium]